MASGMHHSKRRSKRARTPTTKVPSDVDSMRRFYLEGLASIGVPSEALQQDDPREKYFDVGISYGLVVVEGQSVAWINTRGRWEGGNDPTYTDFAVPDPRLAGLEVSSLVIDSIGIRTLSLFGRVKGVKWRGKDYGLGMIEYLNSCKDLSAAWRSNVLGYAGPDVRILAHSSPHAFWRIATTINFPWDDAVKRLSCWRKVWQCVDSLGCHLKSASIGFEDRSLRKNANNPRS